MLRPILCSALMAAFFVSPVFGQSQPQCGPRDAMLSALGERYGESVVGRGLGSVGVMLEIVANPETGTWTVIITQPDGTACLAIEGGQWMGVEYIAPVGDAL